MCARILSLLTALAALPAACGGFIRAEGERFVDDGGEVRLFGVNFTAEACFPERDSADADAERLARLGVNCVRFHYMDATKGDWSKFDYLAAALKRRGIRWNFNLHVGRVPEVEGGAKGTPCGKVVTIFEPSCREWLRGYARSLLRRVNPHTGLAYADDPALAMVEIDNEDSLVVPWLLGDPDHWLGCLETLPARWRAELVRQWNAWRKARGLSAQADFPARKACGDEEGLLALEFLSATDQAFYGGIRDFLRKELGVRCPISGTQLWYATPHVLATLDYVDNHRYWRHPQWDRRPASWPVPLYTGGDAMVNTLEAVIALANERVAGRPYAISEYNHPRPNPYGAEAMPLLCAMGALEGWSAVFHYSYSHRPKRSVFDSVDRMDMLAHYPACAAIFRGGLPRLAHDALPGTEPRKFLADLLHWDWRAFDFNAFRPGFTNAPACLARGGCVEWNRDIPGRAYFKADAPGVKLFTGFPEGRAVPFGDGLVLKIGETSLKWATVSLTARSGGGFRPGVRVLVAATAGGGYTGEEIIRGSWGAGFPDPVLGIVKDGERPYRCEGVPFELTLPPGLAGSTCHAVSEDGRRLRKVPRTDGPSGSVRFGFTAEENVVWYELDLAR